MTLKTWRMLRNELSLLLEAFYPKPEASSLSRNAIEEIVCKRGIDFLKLLDDAPNNRQLEKLNIIRSELLNKKPLQYITGWANFYDLRLKVTNDVLIPRQETEELVRIVLDVIRNRTKLQIADIGTGSGAIIISIAVNSIAGNHTFLATDISEKALEVAANNADKYKQCICLFQHDLLSDIKFPFKQKVDILISNPPYVLQSEKSSMLPNVLDYEPELALFVPDCEPLIYYKQLAKHACYLLNDEGIVFVEINERFGEEVKAVFEGMGFQASIRKDVNNKDRFVIAKKA